MTLFDEIKDEICPEFMEEVTVDKYVTVEGQIFKEKGSIGKFVKC